jgi:hypothetical protein
MIVVQAGNRVDEPGRTPPRFPPERERRVRKRFEALLDLGVDSVVTAAAAGSDLLLVEVALERSIPVHVVLPFAPGKFRDESVADRGERWAQSYDRTLDAVGREIAGSLLVLDFDPDDAGFRATNGALLEHACLLSPGRVLAVAVRPRERRGPPSVTDDFVERAERRGLFVVEIDPLTC